MIVCWLTRLAVRCSRNMNILTKFTISQGLRLKSGF
jgi:hypothetical protein